MSTDIEKLMHGLEVIPKENFTKYADGWNGRISLALIDAVFSMGARYETANGKGVGPNVNALATQWKGAAVDPSDDLKELISLGEETVREVMGRGKVSPGRDSERYKSIAVLEAAQNFVNVGVVNSADITSRWVQDEEFRAKLKNAYTSIPGLGCVTFEYFTMLLGIPGVKADRMIVRFVENALGEGVPSEQRANAAIKEVYEEWRKAEGNNASLIEFEHAIWRYGSEHTHPNKAE